MIGQEAKESGVTGVQEEGGLFDLSPFDSQGFSL
jgi:hypothetical protein